MTSITCTGAWVATGATETAAGALLRDRLIGADIGATAATSGAAFFAGAFATFAVFFATTFLAVGVETSFAAGFVATAFAATAFAAAAFGAAALLVFFTAVFLAAVFFVVDFCGEVFFAAIG